MSDHALQESKTATFPDGQSKTYPVGTPISLIEDDYKKHTAPPVDLASRSGSVMPPANPGRLKDFGSNETGTKLADLGLDAATLGASFIPGAGLPGAAMRIAGPALFGAAKGAMHGNAMDEATSQAEMGGLGEAVGKLAPVAGYTGAMALGGLRKSLPDAMRAAEAFLRQFDRTPMGGALAIPAGAQRRTMNALEAAKGKVGSLIDNSTAQIPGDAFLGAGDEIAAGAGATRDPVRLRTDLQDEEDQFIKSQLQQRNKYVPGSSPAANKQDFRRMDFTPREAQDFQIEQGQIGTPVTEGRINDDIIPATERTRAQVAANSSQHVKGAQEVAIPGLKDARGELSDLMTMQDANVHMRNSGPSAIGVRGAAGYYGSQAINTLAGRDEDNPLIDPKYGALAMLLLGGPRGFSTAMNGLGTAARVIPKVIRGKQVYDDAIDSFTDDGLRVRRKEPK